MGDKAADDAQAFFEANPAEGIDRSVAQALESVRANSAWVERDAAKVAEWLEANA